MTWNPWKLRKQLQTAYDGNSKLWRAIGQVHHELDQLDYHEERAQMSPADRVALYLLEQKAQQKADELGKPVATPCLRCRPLWDDDPLNAELPDGSMPLAPTFHTHMIEPR